MQSTADKCVFYRGVTIFMIYVDDGISSALWMLRLTTVLQLLSPKDAEIDNCFADMNIIFELTDEGNISDYLGISSSFQLQIKPLPSLSFIC